MTATVNAGLNPIDQLSGISLNGGFTIGARMVKQTGQTGGHFSVGYECSSPTGQSVFLKALDLSMALREANVILALQRLTDGVQCEMELLESCRRMDRVVTAVDFGTLRSLNGAPLAIPIPYIIFERATGTARNIVKASSRPSDDWCLVTLHHIATGMRQLHGQMISHSDLKLSNVLMFDQNRGAKIADLGRSVRQGRSVWYDAVEWPGDYSYAPPEVAYSFLDSDFTVRRLSADLFLLGSLATVMFCSVPMNTLMFDQLPQDLRPPRLGGTFVGTFDDALPHLRAAFSVALETVRAALPIDAPYRDRVVGIIQEWSAPHPRERGHPITRSILSGAGNIFDLERYVSELPNLAGRARIFLNGRK